MILARRSVVSSLVAAAATCLFASAAFAQDAPPAREAAPARGAAGVDLAAFTAEVTAAAEAAGMAVPSADAIRAAFAAGDADGSGTLDASESQARGTPTCDSRGVCIRGRCFCVAGHTGHGGDARRENGGVVMDSPIFEAPSSPQQNSLAD